jgi:hypothetical protein
MPEGCPEKIYKVHMEFTKSFKKNNCFKVIV